VGGIVGAKIWYVLLTGTWDALLSRGGFVWYGGFLGGVAGVLLNGWRKRIPARWTMELTAAPLALGYALGRVGCFLINDDYGIPSSLPWAVRFPDGLPPTRVADMQQQLHVVFPPGTNPADLVAVHPTQVYETTLMMLAFWLLWRLRDHHHATGWRFGVYLVLAGAERFLVEIVRAKDDRLLGSFTLAQATSLLLMLVGGALLTKWRQPAGGGPQPLPESLRPKQVSPPPPLHRWGFDFRAPRPNGSRRRHRQQGPRRQQRPGHRIDPHPGSAR